MVHPSLILLLIMKSMLLVENASFGTAMLCFCMSLETIFRVEFPRANYWSYMLGHIWRVDSGMEEELETYLPHDLQLIEPADLGVCCLDLSLVAGVFPLRFAALGVAGWPSFLPTPPAISFLVTYKIERYIDKIWRTIYLFSDSLLVLEILLTLLSFLKQEFLKQNQLVFY